MPKPTGGAASMRLGSLGSAAFPTIETLRQQIGEGFFYFAIMHSFPTKPSNRGKFLQAMSRAYFATVQKQSLALKTLFLGHDTY
jgi:hypothetical protein